MEKIDIEYSHNNSVANVILNDGKGNILDSIMMKELHTAFLDFKENRDIKLITFKGAGKNFSFGASVEEHTKSKCGEMLKSFHQLFFDIIDLAIPTLAKVHGQCLGGGMELVLMCNFIYSCRTAFFGQPEVILGVFAPPASLLLPLKIGSARAEEILLTGNSISALRAYEIGLINNIYEDENEMELKVDEWIIKNIAKKSASSLRFAVKAARTQINSTLTGYLKQLEVLYTNELMATDDANEGINSFIEKRKPDWRNL